MPKEFAVAVVAALPVFELRGSIPLGILSFKMPWQSVCFYSFLGNFIPIVPLLVFLRWAEKRLENIRYIGKGLRWWFDKVHKKSKIVQVYGFWGLALFVAIPVPGSGIWSGAVAATLFEFKLKRAFLAILIGMIIAGILVTLGTLGIFKFLN
ncbi:MAG: small multi-drug export protein [Candidatus Omnitrophota bacterium]